MRKPPQSVWLKSGAETNQKAAILLLLCHGHLDWLRHFQVGLQILTGIAPLDGRNLFRRTLSDDFAAAAAAFRTQINDMIGDLDDVEIVFR